MKLRFALTALSAVFIAVGSARAEFIVGLTSANTLVTFNSDAPGTVVSTVGITGATIAAIDFRPANGELYGLTTGGGLFTIDLLTGLASPVANLTAATGGVGSAQPVPGTLIIPGTIGGFDFNPAANALRIITSTGSNLRVTTAGVNGTGATLTDENISPVGLSIVGSAYTNNVPAAASTTLYGIDTDGNLVVTGVGGANGGVYTVVGSLGVGQGSALGTNTGFDISGLSGTAYASLRQGNGSNSTLYSINLGTGLASSLGQIGGPQLGLVDIAVPVGLTPVAAVPAPGGLLLILTGAATAGLVRRGRRVIG